MRSAGRSADALMLTRTALSHSASKRRLWVRYRGTSACRSLTATDRHKRGIYLQSAQSIGPGVTVMTPVDSLCA